MKYLDSVALAKLGRLNLELRRLSSEGFSAGRHRTFVRGFSHDFSQHRPYAPGDEIKTLDWKLYARQDRFYVREYNEESVLNANVLLDASGSMSYGSKWDYACRLGLAMAYLIIAKGDAAGFVTFDVGPRDRLPPSSRLSHLELIDAALARTRPGRETDLGAVLRGLAGQTARRSLIILVSDLLGDGEAVAKALKAIKAQKYEVVVLQVLDPRERDLDYEGSVVFESLEDGSRISCDASSLRESYRREFERGLKLYESTFHRSEIAYGRFYTDRPWDDSLSRFLSRLR